MDVLKVIILVSVSASVFITVDSVPPQACFAKFRWDDCGRHPKPVIYYWKPGSRCEVGLWRGCLPNINMFKDEYECVSTCIFGARVGSGDSHLPNDIYDLKGNEINDDESKTKNEEESKSKPDSEPESKPDSEPESKPDSEPESKPDSEPEFKPDSEPVSKPDSEPESKPVSETQPNPDSENGPNPDPLTGSNMDSRTESNPGSGTGSNPNSGTGSNPNSGNVSNLDSGTESNSDPEPESEKNSPTRLKLKVPATNTSNKANSTANTEQDTEREKEAGDVAANTEANIQDTSKVANIESGTQSLKLKETITSTSEKPQTEQAPTETTTDFTTTMKEKRSTVIYLRKKPTSNQSD